MAIDIDEEEKAGIFAFAKEQIVALFDGLAAGEYTPGDFAISGVNLLIYIATAAIPGSADDMAVSVFKTTIDAGLVMFGTAIDRYAGINPDAKQMLKRAEKRRIDAAEHEAEAARKDVEGKKLFGRSPERHRERAQELLAEAEALEAQADALEAGA